MLIKPVVLYLVLSHFGALPPDSTPSETKEDPIALAEAVKAFEKAPKNKKKAVLSEIQKRIESSEAPGLQAFLQLAERVEKELKIQPKPKAVYYDPKVYARGLVRRSFANPKKKGDRKKIDEVQELLRSGEFESPIAARYVYDFGDDAVFDTGENPTAGKELEDLLNGHPPGADLVAAWLMKLWDFDAYFDPMARHFDHVYCNLDGLAFPGILLYHAMTSQEVMDMPDVDVIAYAQLIDKDFTYVSPIPHDERRLQLYQRVRDGFLLYFRYRTWIETAAWLYVDPAASIRDMHEPLRARLLYTFALEGGDPEKIAARFQTARDRPGFIQETDQLITKDRKGESLKKAFIQERDAPRIEVKRITRDVLKEFGFLPKEP
ncbi:MAG: hypothetical protein ABIK28_09680 [Planctomycetota bacterium]